jgi:sialate O-acetylesterase
LFVQLANFTPTLPLPADSDWAELREAQAQALALPRTGMAVAIDIGDGADIHPANKQDVGHRLALVARQVAYADKSVVAAGPTFQRMSVRGNQVRLTFTNLGAGLVLKSGNSTLSGFAVAGADQQFHWAAATLAGSEVVLTCAAVPVPVAVRYDWANNPLGNLYNKDGLPAVPFRTDQWTRPAAPKP